MLHDDYHETFGPPYLCCFFTAVKKYFHYYSINELFYLLIFCVKTFKLDFYNNRMETTEAEAEESRVLDPAL